LNSSAPPAALDPHKLPRHVAIIMDGNGRWAKQRLLNRIKGHEKGAEAVRDTVKTCRELGIPHLTLYAFSTENWQRPPHEVEALMGLLRRFLETESDNMTSNNIRLGVIGEVADLPPEVRTPLARVMEGTRANDGLHLTLALSYGSRHEIVHMARTMAAAVQRGELAPEDIREATVSDHLYTRGLPDPDILIRTSGEQRLSNFLLWQLAYTELFFTPTLWPDFNRDELIGILHAFQNRERRFGAVDPA
jgi:undecaprenyl diphosphate synthase